MDFRITNETIDKIMPRIQQIQKPSIPKRLYTEEELKDFDQKIQKFWDEPRIIGGHEAAGSISAKGIEGKEARKFRYNALAVAYGAFVKRVEGDKTYYLVVRHDGDGPSRFEQFDNLMKQWEWWKQGLDWKREYAQQKQAESYNPENVEETDVLF